MARWSGEQEGPSWDGERRTPQEMVDKADEITKLLAGLPLHQLEEELDRLENQHPVLFSLVSRNISAIARGGLEP